MVIECAIFVEATWSVFVLFHFASLWGISTLLPASFVVRSRLLCNPRQNQFVSGHHGFFSTYPECPKRAQFEPAPRILQIAWHAASELSPRRHGVRSLTLVMAPFQLPNEHHLIYWSTVISTVSKCDCSSLPLQSAAAFSTSVRKFLASSGFPKLTRQEYNQSVRVSEMFRVILPFATPGIPTSSSNFVSSGGIVLQPLDNQLAFVPCMHQMKHDPWWMLYHYSNR